MTKRIDKKKVLIAIIVLGLLLSGFTFVAGAYYVGSSESDVYHYRGCPTITQRPIEIIQ